MVPQEFYDLRAKKKYKSSEYVTKKRGKMTFLVAQSPSGVASWKLMPRAKPA